MFREFFPSDTMLRSLKKNTIFRMTFPSVVPSQASASLLDLRTLAGVLCRRSSSRLLCRVRPCRLVVTAMMSAAAAALDFIAECYGRRAATSGSPSMFSRLSARTRSGGCLPFGNDLFEYYNIIYLNTFEYSIQTAKYEPYLSSIRTIIFLRKPLRRDLANFSLSPRALIFSLNGREMT